MNVVFEQKLSELIEEAERAGSAAGVIVLKLLLSNYRKGTQNKFAKHCCSFSPIQILMEPAKIDAESSTLPEMAINGYTH